MFQLKILDFVLLFVISDRVRTEIMGFVQRESEVDSSSDSVY